MSRIRNKSQGSRTVTSQDRNRITHKSTRPEVLPKHFVILAILSGSRRGKRCYRSKTDKVKNRYPNRLSTITTWTITAESSTEGQRGRKAHDTANIPKSKLVIILPVNGTVHHKVHLKGVKEPGADSSRQETQETTRERNLQIQPQLALSDKGNN